MLSAYFSVDGVRVASVVILAIAQAVMAGWPEWRRWSHTVPSRSANQSLPIVPIDWAFAIWGVIFLGCAVFAVWQALPAQLDDPLLRSIGWLAAAAFALNALWEYYVPKRDIGWGSVAIIGLALVVLLTIVNRLASADLSDGTAFWVVAAPLQLLAGWISAATFVNFGSAMKLNGWSMRRGPCLILLACAGALGFVVALLSGAIVYAAAVAWALFGIVIANRTRDYDRVVAGSAAVLMPVVLGSALIGG